MERDDAHADNFDPTLQVCFGHFTRKAGCLEMKLIRNTTSLDVVVS